MICLKFQGLVLTKLGGRCCTKVMKQTSMPDSIKWLFKVLNETGFRYISRIFLKINNLIGRRMQNKHSREKVLRFRFNYHRITIIRVLIVLFIFH